MARNDRVIWSEGMFLRPHHYQQYTRYLETLVDQRSVYSRPFSWGFAKLELDQAALGLGRIALSAATGIFPDGTPFDMPLGDSAPAALEFPADLQNALVYLAVPLRRAGQSEIERGKDPHSLARYLPSEIEIADDSSLSGSTVTIQVGRLRTRLMLPGERRDDYAYLAVARIIERRADGRLQLDPDYLPPLLDCHASSRLLNTIREIAGLITHRIEALAARVGDAGRGGGAEVADFLMLQTLNRTLPVLADSCSTPGDHPQQVYRQLLAAAGELQTFASADRKAAAFGGYRHDDLQACFEPVVRALRQVLSSVLEQAVISIALAERKYGIRVATVNDRALFESARFVLAVAADMPLEELFTRIPAQSKIGPVEQIRQLVNVQLPGIRLRPLPVAPRQIPYHSGFVYFELEQSGELWRALSTAGGIALHIGGDFPGLKLELWAIREST